MVSYLTIQGHLLGEETSTRARKATSQTTKPMGIERERDTFFFFISLFSNCLCLVLFWQTPLTLANSLFCSLPLLVICGFRVPTKLCASKGASGKCHFKLHAARKSQTPSLRSQICSKSGQMSAPLSHPPGDCYIWRAEAGDLKRKKKLHNQCCNLLPTSHIVSLQSQNKPQGRKREVYIAWSYAAYKTMSVTLIYKEVIGRDNWTKAFITFGILSMH